MKSIATGEDAVSANNPLLQPFDLPPYSAILPEHVEPAIDAILADNRAAIADLLSRQSGTPSWDGLVLALDELGERAKHVFILFRLEGRKQKDIAALYGISVSAVEKHIMAAMLHLMKRFGPA